MRAGGMLTHGLAPAWQCSAGAVSQLRPGPGHALVVRDQPVLPGVRSAVRARAGGGARLLAWRLHAELHRDRGGLRPGPVDRAAGDLARSSVAIAALRRSCPDGIDAYCLLSVVEGALARDRPRIRARAAG